MLGHHPPGDVGRATAFQPQPHARVRRRDVGEMACVRNAEGRAPIDHDIAGADGLVRALLRTRRHHHQLNRRHVARHQLRHLRRFVHEADGEAIADFFYTVEQERQAIERALAHYDTLGLSGLALIIDGRLAGFTFSERITPDVGNVLVEKTNFAIPGSAQYLFREFAKTFIDCTYINVGDDLGLENLRRVKMGYRPALFGDKIVPRRRLA